MLRAVYKPLLSHSDIPLQLDVIPSFHDLQGRSRNPFPLLHPPTQHNPTIHEMCCPSRMFSATGFRLVFFVLRQAPHQALRKPQLLQSVSSKDGLELSSKSLRNINCGFVHTSLAEINRRVYRPCLARRTLQLIF